MSTKVLRALASVIDWADRSPVTWADLQEKIEKAAKKLEEEEGEES